MTWDVGLISRGSSWLSLSMYVRIASSWARILSISSSARPSRASLATCYTSRRVIFIAASSTEGIEMIAFYDDPAKIFQCLLLVPTLTASADPSLRAPLVADPERLGPGPAPLALPQRPVLSSWAAPAGPERHCRERRGPPAGDGRASPSGGAAGGREGGPEGVASDEAYSPELVPLQGRVSWAYLTLSFLTPIPGKVT